MAKTTKIVNQDNLYLFVNGSMQKHMKGDEVSMDEEDFKKAPEGRFADKSDAKKSELGANKDGKQEGKKDGK